MLMIESFEQSSVDSLASCIAAENSSVCQATHAQDVRAAVLARCGHGVRDRYADTGNAASCERKQLADGALDGFACARVLNRHAS